MNRALIDARRAPATTVDAGVSDAQIEAIPGWFTSDDIRLFRFFLGEQVRSGQGETSPSSASTWARARR